MNIHEKQQLFQQQFRVLFNFAYKYVSWRVQPKEDVEDIVSHVLTEAYAKLKQYDELKGSLQQWLAGIVRFKVIDYWRQNSKRTFELEQAEQVVDEITQVALREAELDDQMLFKKIMYQLPDHIRVLFTLRYIDDLTYQEIADIVNRKATTIRKIFSETHQKLREQFSDQYLGEV